VSLHRDWDVVGSISLGGILLRNSFGQLVRPFVPILSGSSTICYPGRDGRILSKWQIVLSLALDFCLGRLRTSPTWQTVSVRGPLRSTSTIRMSRAHVRQTRFHAPTSGHFEGVARTRGNAVPVVKNLPERMGTAFPLLIRNPHAIASIKPRDAAQPQSIIRSRTPLGELIALPQTP